MKTCTKCGEEKALSEYGANRNCRGGLSPECRACATERARIRRRANPEPYRVACRKWRKEHAVENYAHQRRFLLRKQYGISPAEFDAMVVAQNGKCAICTTAFDLVKRTGKFGAHIDHCHASGRVRGILCNRCNSMLGYSLDDPSILGAGIAYLAKHSSRREIKLA